MINLHVGGILVVGRVGGWFFKLNGSSVDRVGVVRLKGFGEWVGQCLVWVEGCGLRMRN